MSNWTYISGSVGLEREAYLRKLNKDGTYKRGSDGWVVQYLPYPEEQFKMLNPEPISRKKTKGKGKNQEEYHHAALAFEASLSSFPIVKRIVAEAIKIMSCGEQSLIGYSLIEANWYRGSSNYFNSKQTEKLLQNAIMKQYDEEYFYDDWKDFNRYRNWELVGEQSLEDSTLVLQDSIRWVKASEVYEALMVFLKKLSESGIAFNHGSFAFYDIYPIKYFIEINYDTVTCHITNTETGESSCEYYQIFCYHHRSEEDKPVSIEFKKVDEPVEDTWIEV